MNKVISLIILSTTISLITLNTPNYSEIPETSSLVKKWNTLATALMLDTEENKIVEVNNFVNSNIEYMEDIVQYNKNDYWATPKETLINKKGDCEDIAILKYKLLLLLGVPESDMYLVYSKQNNVAHVELEIKEGNDILILGNPNPRILIKDSDYSKNEILKFNRNFVVMNNTRYPSKSLKRINDLLSAPLN